MAITDLTNTMWYIPAGWSATAGYGQFSVNCTVNNSSQGRLDIGYGFDYDNVEVVLAANTIYTPNVYKSSTELVITITGGTDVTNPKLISWLETNGELQVEEEIKGVTIEYAGSIIATVEDGNIATLPIKDRKMVSDIVVTVPWAEEIVLQEKTITPTKAVQEVTADEGNDGLSKVTVNSIPNEYIIPSGSLNITENKTVDVTNYASVTVAVPSKEPKLQEKTATENGEVTADEGYDGLSKVTVNVPSEELDLEEIIITENGEYTPSGDGFSKVTVAVAGEAATDFTVTLKDFANGGSVVIGNTTYTGDAVLTGVSGVVTVITGINMSMPSEVYHNGNCVVFGNYGESTEYSFVFTGNCLIRSGGEYILITMPYKG